MQQADARPGSAPAAIGARELEMAEARSGSALPLIGDLSVLKSTEMQPRPSREPSAAVQPPPRRAPEQPAATDARRSGPASDRIAIAEPPASGIASDNRPQSLATGETRLPPLSLAPLDGAITALERDYESLGQRDRRCEVGDATQTLTLPRKAAAGSRLRPGARRRGAPPDRRFRRLHRQVPPHVVPDGRRAGDVRRLY